ncbi:MAG TPA: hypothetical protein VHO69_13840, partial [Phototrophicaceae bacterium]|nr:hypothetical protein [Phototrophicaceae bacterium]
RPQMIGVVIAALDHAFQFVKDFRRVLRHQLFTFPGKRNLRRGDRRQRKPAGITGMAAAPR